MSGCRSGEEKNVTGRVEARWPGGFAVLCRFMHEGVESTVNCGDRESRLAVEVQVPLKLE